jgi:hypothetical protein
MIEPELLAMAKKIDSGELPLNPNAYALAVYEGYEKLWKRQATEAERERVIALLEARRYDLASCLKDDDCAVRADAIEVCISDIKGEIE